MLERAFIGFKLLGEHVEREVSRRLLPGAIAAYRAWQTLNFGALCVTPQGLRLEETRKDLPWEQLGEVYEAGGYLVIQKKGTLTAWRIEVSIFFCALLTMDGLLFYVKRTEPSNRLSTLISYIEMLPICATFM